MYKNQDKRRDKDRDRQRRYRASKGVTGQNMTEGVTNEATAGPSVDELKPIDSKVSSGSINGNRNK